jgi:hypothetical protein
VEYVASMVEKRGVYRILVRGPDGRRSLGRARRIWVYNKKMELKEMGSVMAN